MKWQRRIPSTRDELHIARTKALEALEKWGIPSQELFELNLILCELLANAAEHGNHWQQEKEVFLSIRFYPQKNMVFLLAVDEGKKEIKPVTADTPCSERGRGLLLLETLADRSRTGCGRVWVRKEVAHGKNSAGS